MNPYRGDDAEACPRYERDELFNREVGLPPKEHTATCPSCSTLADKYRRLERVIADHGVDVRPAGDWQAKVRARILNDRPRQRERSMSWIVGAALAVGLASVGAATYIVVRSSQQSPRTPVSIPPEPEVAPPPVPVPSVPVVPRAAPRAPVSPPAPTVAPRAVGARSYVSGRYTLFNDGLDYKSARSACKQRGEHLVTIESAEENAALRGLAAVADKTPYGWSDVWIGLDDQEKTGTYRWVTGMGAQFLNWSPGEPNHGAGTDDERCAVYKGSTVEGVWDDRPCTIPYPYICERD